jgi:autotransporter passenger strand-loop-strand repeat protein
MDVNFIAGTNYNNAPSVITSALSGLATFYDNLFTTNLTLDVTVNYVDLGGQQANGGVVLANNNVQTAGTTASFATVHSALLSHETTQDQQQAYQYMPSGLGNLQIAPGEAYVLGLSTNNTIDLTVNINSNSAVVPSQYDWGGVVGHELTETSLGRYIGKTDTVMDLFRYSSSGAHDTSVGTSSTNSTAYFSIDNGATNLGTWNNDGGNKYDLGDWVISGFPDSGDPAGDPVANDAYGAGGNVVSEVDIELMNMLGYATDAVVAGDQFDVANGQTSSGFTVMSGGSFVVASGGVANNTYYTDAQGFIDGAPMTASAGAPVAVGYIFGQEVGATVDGGGYEYIENGGVAVSATVLVNGSQVNYGLSEDTVLSGGYEGVAAAASAYYTSVLSGATLHLDSHSYGYGEVVLAGGSETVWGYSDVGTVAAEGSQTVSSGGTDEFGTISGAQSVYGSTLYDTVTGGGAEQYVESGGVTLNTTVTSYCFQTVLSGGTDESSVISGFQDVYGSAVGDIVLGVNNYQQVEGGGVAQDSVIEDLGDQFVQSAGYTDATTISAGGSAFIESGGFAESSTIGSGGLEYVYSGATDYYATIGTSGTQYVDGAAYGAIVSSGGDQVVSSGGDADFTTIDGLGSQTVSYDGLDEYGLVSGYQSVYGTVSSGQVAGVQAYQYIESGGSAYAETLDDLGFSIVSSGGVASRTAVDSAGALFIESGGVAEATVVNSGATETVYLGGEEDSPTINAGGYLYVRGAANGAVVNSAGTEVAETSGYADGASVLAGGQMNIYEGGLAAAVQVAAGGTLTGPGEVDGENYVAGAVDRVTVGGAGGDYGYLAIESGGAASGVVLQDGYLLVDQGAIATATTLSSAGAYGAEEDDFGSAVGASIDAGSVESVFSGGVAMSATANSGGLQTVTSGGLASGTTVLSGGQMAIESGGVGTNLQVSAGGMLSGPGEIDGYNYVAGSVSGVTVGGAADDEGYLEVEAGGAAEAVTVQNYELQVDQGATATGTSIGSGGVEAVDSGAVSTNAVVSSGGQQSVASGGGADGTLVENGGTEFLYGGAATSGVTVGSGGRLELYADVVSAGESLLAARLATKTVLGGARLSSGAVIGLLGTTILSGGAVRVSSGGLAVDTAISSGGSETVTMSGIANQVTVSSGATLHLSSGGVADHTILWAGGVERVSSGALAAADVILSGGAEYVFAGGLDSAARILPGGRLHVSSGGKAELATISSGGEQIVSGTASGTVVLSAGEDIVVSGGVDLGAAVSSGGKALVSAGGVASGATVLAGGVLSGPGEVAGTTQDAGKIVGAVVSGALTVSSGGLLSGGALVAGSTDVILPGGSAARVTLSSGAERISVGGEAAATVISSGGVEYLLSGGVGSGAQILAGGELYASSGGVLAGDLTISGGTVQVTSGAMTAGATVTFVGAGGDLVLGSPPSFSGTIAGLSLKSQKVDLAGFAYSSAGEKVSWSEAASHTSGTLTITDGAQVAKLRLLGDYVTSDFALSTDGHGGSYVADPPPTGYANSVARFAQAMASVGAPGGPLGGHGVVSSGSGLLTPNVTLPGATSAAHG